MKRRHRLLVVLAGPLCAWAGCTQLPGHNTPAPTPPTVWDATACARIGGYPDAYGAGCLIDSASQP